MTNTGTAFDYIVTQILNRRCVPVAGAGISLFSVDSKNINGPRVHNVDWIVATLKNDLILKRIARYSVKTHGGICCSCSNHMLKKRVYLVTEINNCFFCDVRSAAEGKKLGNLSELFLWEFGLLADAHVALIKLLKIRSYKDLEPTLAHKFIARIAREGLIDEVLTTNYDCNFENAYNQIAGGKYSDVISSLDDHRQKGAKHGLINRLKVYKVNGCAEELGDGTDAKKCESILLTDRQLQTWGNRRWAADVFRDRLRSRSLLFVGFGSDEPQIHHTLQAVLDEYSQDIVSDDLHVLETSAAPVVAIFDPQPTFHQQQIVNTYALHHKQKPIEGDSLIIRNPVPGGTLTADALWILIYERVVRAAVIDGLELSLLAVNASFTSIVPFAKTILLQVKSSLEKSIENDVEHSTDAPSWLNSFSLVCGDSVGSGQYYYALMNCFSTMINNNEKYAPVSENKALLSEFILLFYLLKENISKAIKTEIDSTISLEMKTKEIQSTNNKALYITAKSSGISSVGKVSKQQGSTQLILALGQGGVRYTPSLVRVFYTDPSSGSVTPRKLVTLSWQHIFHEKKYKENMDSVAATILDAIHSPTGFYYSNQPSMNRRKFLRELPL